MSEQHDMKGEPSRQLKWQRERIARGLCSLCGRPLHTKVHCKDCTERRLRRQREARGIPFDWPKWKRFKPNAIEPDKDLTRQDAPDPVTEPDLTQEPDPTLSDTSLDAPLDSSAGVTSEDKPPPRRSRMRFGKALPPKAIAALLKEQGLDPTEEAIVKYFIRYDGTCIPRSRAQIAQKFKHIHPNTVRRALSQLQQLKVIVALPNGRLRPVNLKYKEYRRRIGLRRELKVPSLTKLLMFGGLTPRRALEVAGEAL